MDTYVIVIFHCVGLSFLKSTLYITQLLLFLYVSFT